MSGGGKTQTTKSTTQIPAEVLASYNKAVGMASNAAATPWKSYSSDPNAFVAPLTASQNAGMSNINQYAQSAQPWFQGAGAATVAGLGNADLGSLNVDQYMSPYLKDVAQSTSDLMNQQHQQAMSGQRGTASQAGAAWGDRAGIAAANLNQQQNLSNASILSNLLNQGYTQAQAVAQQQQGADLSARQADLARLMAGGQQLGELGTNAQAAALQGGEAQMAAGQQQQQTQQAGLSALYNQWLQQQAYPFQTSQFFANIAEGIGSNSGSTNTTKSPAGIFSGLARGGRAGKAAGGGLAGASMGGHVGMEHALEGFAVGGAPQDYAGNVLQGLFGGADPSNGAYGIAGNMPGTTSFVPKPNMPVAGLRPPQPVQVEHPTTLKDVANTAKDGYDLYNSDDGQKAVAAAKNALAMMLGSPNPSQAATGGRIGYAQGGSPFSQDPIMGIPDVVPSAGYVPDPTPLDQKGLQPSKAASASQSDGLGKVADLVKIAATIIPFLKDGGVAGPRRGYDAGGTPTADESWSDWFDRMLPMNGTAAGPAPHPEPPPPAPTPAAPSPGLAPAAPPPNNTQALNQAQKDAQKSVDQLWAESQDPHMGRIQSGLKMGEAALTKGLGVYLPGMINWANGDPMQANGIGGAPATASAAPTPAAPTGGVVPTAATTPAAPVSAAPAGDFRSPGGLQAPGPTASAPPISRPHPPGLAPQISPVEQMAGNKVQNPGLEQFQWMAGNHENRNAINYRDPNGGTRAGFNLAQYQAINPRIRSLADVQQHDILDAQAHWWRQQNGDAIQAKYGPAFAASYADLSMLNPTMAAHALAQAGGDPARFFDAMGNKLAALGQNPKYAANTAGWLKRVNDTKQFALSNGQSGAANTAVASASGTPDVMPVADNGLGNAKLPPGSVDSTNGLAGPTVQPAADMPGGQPNGFTQAVGGAGQWLGQHGSDLILPALTGLGAMASSPSRYLGSAILQGIGAGAGTYMKRQSQLADIANKNSVTLNNLAQVFPNSLFSDPKSGLTWVKTTDPRRPMVTIFDFANDPSFHSPFGDEAAKQIRNLYQQNPQGFSGSPDSSSGASDQPVQPNAPAAGTILSPSEVQVAAADKSDRANAGASGYTGWMDQRQGIMANTTAAVVNKPSVDEMLSTSAGAIAQGNVGSFENTYASTVLQPLKTLLSKFGIDTTGMSDADTQQKLLEKLGTINASQMTPEEQRAASVFQDFQRVSPNLEMTPQAVAEISAMIKTNNQRDIDRGSYYSDYANHSGGNMLHAETSMNSHYNYAAEKEAISTMMQSAKDDPRVAQFLQLASSGAFQNGNQANIAMKSLFANDPAMMKIINRNPKLYRYFSRSGIEGQ